MTSSPYIRDNKYRSEATSISVSDARSRLAAIIERTRADRQPVFLERRGQRVAAVLDAGELQRLIELAEDMADIRAAEASRSEMTATGEAPVPWDEVKAELGLT